MTLMHRRGLFALAAGAAFVPALAWPQTAITGAQPGVTNARNVADTLAADARFTRFLDLLSRGGLVENLRGAGPFTIFAPVDTAWTGAPAGQLQNLLQGAGNPTERANPDMIRLRALLEYHILNGTLTPSELAGAGTRDLRTMNGSPVRLASSGSGATVVNPAPGTGAGFGATGLAATPPIEIQQPAIPASNGIIYPINGVLLP